MHTFKNNLVRICQEIAKPNVKEFNRLQSLSECASLVETQTFIGCVNVNEFKLKKINTGWCFFDFE